MYKHVLRSLPIILGFFFSLSVFSQSPSIQQNHLAKESTEAFENVTATPLTEGFKVSWNIQYHELTTLQNEGFQIVLGYLPEKEAGNSPTTNDMGSWQTLENLDWDQTQAVLTGLKGGEAYAFRLGLKQGDQTTWSDQYSIKTNKKWGLFDFLVLLGSLAMFLYGMKTMSDGLQKAAGSRLRNLLGSITSSPIKGVLTGFGITTLVQSSSVTTIMAVSFVNAGILTLMQSAGVVMGANIGTTVTAWIVDIFGFKVDIGPYTLVLLAIGLPLYFMNSSRTKGWANAIIGFSLLFMGLGFLKDAVPELSPDSGIVQFFVNMNSIPYISTILFVIFGAILTLIIQSSSATIALTMTLMVSGVIPFEVGAAMVLGENIGTTITAELASSVGNVYAKRTARIHSAFNTIGVTWVLLIFPFFIDAVVYLTENLGGGNPVLNPQTYGSTGLAILHTTFNLANVLLMIGFVPHLVRFAEKTVKSKDGKDEQFHLRYIGEAQNLAPNLSILEAKKELAHFGEIASKMSVFTRELLSTEDKKIRKELLKRIQKREEITDRVEVEIANYLNKIMSNNTDSRLAARINGMNRIASNLERIGDLFYQISISIEKKNEEDLQFSEEQEKRLYELLDLIDQSFAVMLKNLNKHSEEVTLVEAKKMERLINLKRDEIRKEYYSSLSSSETVNMERGILYTNIFSSLERIGDHIINVTEGIMGKV